MNRKVSSEIPAPLDCLVMWSHDPDHSLTICCKAPVEFTLLPEILKSGRKPAVKKFYRCSQCKKQNFTDTRGIYFGT